MTVAVLGGAVVGVVTRRSEAVTVVPPGADWPPAEPSFGDGFFAATNAFRARHGVPALIRLASLQASATWKVEHMAAYEYLSHDDPAPPLARGWDARVADNGYHGAAGENICYGTHLTPQAALDLLVSEGPGEGHYENIVSPGWTVCGLAAATDPGSGNTFYAQDFGVAPATGPQPVVESIAPSRGRAGDVVTVLGQHLESTTLVVFPQNVRAVFAVLQFGTSLQAKVPAGAVSGPIVVATPGGYAASAPFTVDNGPSPPPVAEPLIRKGWRYQQTESGVLVEVLADVPADASPAWPVSYEVVRSKRHGSLRLKLFKTRYRRVTA